MPRDATFHLADEVFKAGDPQHHAMRARGISQVRAGHYTRKLHTKAGEVELRVPKLEAAAKVHGESTIRHALAALTGPKARLLTGTPPRAMHREVPAGYVLD
jgi:hypothetical protein